VGSGGGREASASSGISRHPYKKVGNKAVGTGERWRSTDAGYYGASLDYGTGDGSRCPTRPSSQASTRLSSHSGIIQIYEYNMLVWLSDQSIRVVERKIKRRRILASSGAG
jgi:hypothetical protein